MNSKSIYEFDKIDQFLNFRLKLLKSKNNAYSLRAFARDLGISPSRLSNIISKNQNVSFSLLQKIGKKINLSKTDLEYLELIIRKNSPKEKYKRQINQKIRSLKNANGFDPILTKYSKHLNNENSIFLMHLLSLNQFSIEEIFKKLEISVQDGMSTVHELLESKLLKFENEKWTKTKAWIRIESEMPSEVVKNFHKKQLYFASKFIDIRPIKERKFVSCLVNLKKSDVESARIRIEQFCTDFCKTYGNNKDSDSVGSLGVQFYLW